MEDSPQKIRHKEDSPHNECDREFERKRRTNVCSSANVENMPRNGDKLGLGGVGIGGLRSGELGQGIGVGGFSTLPNPPRPQLPQPNPNSTFPTLTLLTPTLPTQTPLPTPTYHRCVANLPHQLGCKRLSDAYAQILGHIRMSHPLCGESSLWRIFCGESSMW